jgi:hypothetical protein
VLSSELARYADFSVALMHLHKPEGATLAWSTGSDIVGSMNTLCRAARGDWLWILGDDHVFAPGLLLQLLAHEVDVVVPLCLKRAPPYDAVVYSHQNEDGLYVGDNDLPEHGLTEVHAAGSAGMLLSRRVLDTLEDPIFETDGGGMNEDLVLCRKLRAAGFQIWCDVDARLGHIGLVSVWPQHVDGEWKIALNLGNGETLTLNRYVREEVAA